MNTSPQTNGLDDPIAISHLGKFADQLEQAAKLPSPVVARQVMAVFIASVGVQMPMNPAFSDHVKQDLMSVIELVARHMRDLDTDRSVNPFVACPVTSIELRHYLQHGEFIDTSLREKIDELTQARRDKKK